MGNIHTINVNGHSVTFANVGYAIRVSIDGRFHAYAASRIDACRIACMCIARMDARRDVA